MESLSLWLEENKLSLHLGNTESILFASNQRLKKTAVLDITCNGIKVKAKESVKYLGVTLDQSLSGKIMGTSILKKINAKVKFLYRKRIFFGAKEKKMLCSALVQSSFDYACNCWFRGLSKCIKTKLQSAQNRIVRYILNYSSRQHLSFVDFNKLKWLNVSFRVDYLTLNLMYSIHTKCAPSYLCNVEPVNHQYSTRRSSQAYVLPNVKSQGSKTFIFNAVKLWNELPGNVKKFGKQRFV